MFEEQKIPACVGLAEAQDEADRAAEVQTAHLEAYGNLARLPLPLFVFRHADGTGGQVLDALRASLSRRAFDTVEPWVVAGLKRCDPEQVVGRWVQGFVRTLTWASSPGPCTPGAPDRAASPRTPASTAASVATLLTGGTGQDVRADLHHLTGHLLALVQDCLESEHRPGLTLDPRVRRYFTPSRSFGDLVERLGTYHSRTESDVVAAAADFGEFGLGLIAAHDQPAPEATT